MSKQNKFGAFGGVFTPSVLTILGVIMYMRLGWVVGSAGLITALIIILISHIISLTTGLSISSIATDKKIKTGGIYYILSRSLGFPMGGAIGIALFVGTALGISLYLIGFAESLLSVDQIRDFLHLKQDLNSYRIIGSLALLLLVTIAFISTSLAIKSQYFILVAIALSLVSILIGFFTNTSFAPETISFTPSRSGVDLQLVFAVFFPAVTGFTAGVAMSGDLKDPKKDIPFGTMAAIIVGFIIYVGLAVSFAIFVNRDLLISDYNFLLKVAYIPALVLAGIWGATLSSALGGILGGPRIIQAISKDKITPKIFAKGYGASNEPRNALIFIALIAEGGILIGDLNVIAGVVSMFYLASYGFINLAFFLENWASTDFRPTFKVKGVIGLIGFVASFAVMAQLGMISMIISLVMMLGLYAWLNRKQLQSESGDVWQSVWLSVVRRALHSLDKKTLEDRNWQPNIILFSGGKGQRTHLMEFGMNLVGKYGLLSNFDLHESENKKYLFPKHLQSQVDEDIEGKGIFTRRQTCSDIYTGIETIVSTYGFSGIEPNTVILGWMRQSKNPIRFSQMINRINELDVNLLLIDYDTRYGYGNYKTIDIWWRGAGNNGNLALNLVKFLWASEKWANAKLRLLVGNPVNEESSKLRQHAEEVLSNMRIEAEIKILNNQIEQKPFYELIRTESLKTDLIILGMPNIEDGKEQEFVENTSKLMLDIGTVVLIKASSQFKKQSLGHSTVNQQDNNNDDVKNIHENSVKLILPESPIGDNKIEDLSDKLISLNYKHFNKAIKPQFNKYNTLINNIIAETKELSDNKIINLLKTDEKKSDKKIIVAMDMFIKKTQNYVKLFSQQENTSFFSNELNNLFFETDKIISKIPETYLHSDASTKRKSYKVQFKKLVKKHLPYEYYKLNFNAYKFLGVLNNKITIELHGLIKVVRTSLLKLNSAQRNNLLTNELINNELLIIKSELSKIEQVKEESNLSIINYINNQTIETINKISLELKNVKAKKTYKSLYSKKQVLALKEQILKVPNLLIRNEELIANYWNLELKLLDFENKLYRISRKSILAVDTFIEDEVLFKIVKIKESLNSFLTKFKNNNSAVFENNEFTDIPSQEIIFTNFKTILDTKFEKLKYLIEKFPDKVTLLTNEAFNDFAENQFNELETIELSCSALIDYIMQTEFHTPLFNMAEELPKDLIKIENSAQNILRVVVFSLFDADGKIINKEENTADRIVKFISEKLENLNELENEIKLKIENVNRNIDERLSEVSNKLSVYSLIKQIDTTKGFSKTKKNTEKKHRIKSKLKQIQNTVNEQVNNFKYNKDSFILNKNFNKKKEKSLSKISNSLNLLEKVSINKNVSLSLPFYYKQLFLRNNNYNKNFFKGRQNELLAIEKVIERYKSGYHGALLITGERYSGKTFLSQYAMSSFLPDSKIYTITPPLEGSVNTKTFKTKLALEFDANGSYERKFSKIPNGSVIIFDEAELWWEKSENGFDIFNEIIDLIETYGKKFLFVININIFAFNIIKKVNNIEDYLLDIVECKPFTAYEIKDAIMFRHNSGGFPFMFKNKMQDNLRQAEYNKLFSEYLTYSKGNIGVALIAWTANIAKYKENTLYIKPVFNEDLNYFENLETDILLVLVQFIIHKHLTSTKLARIMFTNENIVNKQIAYLKRSGIITTEFKGIFEINKFLYIHLKLKLTELGMI